MTYDELQILHEDNHIIVVVKPRGVPSQADDSGDPDMLSLVREYVKVTYNKPGNVYIGLVHRLDRPTGGVMVFARTSKAAERLSADLREGNMEKRYFAVVLGQLRAEAETLEHYLVKDEGSNTTHVASPVAPGAKRAYLTYRALECQEGLTLCDITLGTGRSHQIRVQMQAIGRPVFGDMRYGGDKAVRGGLALWAYQLKLSHPVTHIAMTFRAAPPMTEIPWSLFRTVEATLNKL
ncbi:MAG: RluA family pseudouridine synthase [Clostridiales bacterium]|jgi:23S rRNA pseudouridine1911/1915/1917 synthase|nr:RluA family pseudouridine synthase [Clostridiales bacterium]